VRCPLRPCAPVAFGSLRARPKGTSLLCFDILVEEDGKQAEIVIHCTYAALEPNGKPLAFRHIFVLIGNYQTDT